jgi:large subunit ribosomal protein L17
MRHRVKGRKLGRTASHRKATLIALATSLLKHKRIKTTLAKAKETRSFVERLITKAKKNDLQAQKQVIEFIKDKETVKELFAEIIPKIGDRPGGYTRVIKLGNRLGDAASMALIELVDYNDILNAKDEERKAVRETKAKEKKKDEEKQAAEEAQFVEETAEEKQK